MRIIPLTLREANDLVASLHRHHQPVTGHRFSIGLEHEGRLVGAAIMGRPVARMTDWHRILEVTRLVTDGTENACSALYGAAARVARDMGFDSIQTFILETEPGTSLLASGWIRSGDSAGGSWNRPSRSRTDNQPTIKKTKWTKQFRTTSH